MQADLLDVLTRLASASNIRCMRVTPPFDGLDQFDYGLRKALDPYFDWQEFGSLLLQSTPPNTLLFAEGTFELQFALFRIHDISPSRCQPRYPWCNTSAGRDTRT